MTEGKCPLGEHSGVCAEIEIDKLTAWLVDVQRKLPQVRERLAYLSGQQNVFKQITEKKEKK